MKTIATQIQNAKTTTELEAIVDAIPRQENGSQVQVARHLGDAFWYEFKSIEDQKNWMLKIVTHYKA